MVVVVGRDFHFSGLQCFVLYSAAPPPGGEFGKQPWKVAAHPLAECGMLDSEPVLLAPPHGDYSALNSPEEKTESKVRISQQIPKRTPC